jgi:YesN/AraC family two-component response regulator
MVVSDVMMPEMDGIELCQKLKQTMETSHIPVILLTAKSDTADVVAGYRSGAEAYVAKPFEPEALALQIKNIMQLQKKRQTQVQQATDQSDIDATTLSELDKQFIRQINELVDQNLGNSDFAVGDITRALLVSRSLLHTKMKSLVGLSTGDFIRKKRMDRACQMLRQGYNVSETAYATGFSDPNYFSKTFKKHLGVNPSEYR